MKKKVLFLSPLPPPHYGSAMSSEMCLNILKKSKFFKVKNIKLNYSKNMGDIGRLNLGKLIGFFKVMKKIKRELKKFNPEIIYFVPATSSLGLIRDHYFVKKIRKYWKGKIIFHIRARILKEDWSNSKKRKMIVGMLKNQKIIILGTELIKDLNNLTSPRNIFILPNAIKNEISEKQLEVLMKKRSISKGLKIIFISNMDRSKGWLKLLRVCKLLNNRDIKFKCIFVGPWNSRKDKKFFKKFVRENNLRKKVFSVGKKIGDEKKRFLENSNVMVFPTDYKLETFGRVIIEGMMFGIPVIANGVATIPSIIENKKTGFILKKNSEKEIFDYLIRLEDKGLREKMGKNGRKRFIEKFSLKIYEKEFIKLIK